MKIEGNVKFSIGDLIEYGPKVLGRDQKASVLRYGVITSAEIILDHEGIQETAYRVNGREQVTEEQIIKAVVPGYRSFSDAL